MCSVYVDAAAFAGRSNLAVHGVIFSRVRRAANGRNSRNQNKALVEKMPVVRFSNKSRKANNATVAAARKPTNKRVVECQPVKLIVPSPSVRFS